MIIQLEEANYSYDNLISDAKALAEQYENILKYVTIGKSHDNRDIVLLKLGTGQKNMICCAGVHGRESVNPIILMKMMEYYADLYVHYKEQKSNLKEQLQYPRSNYNEEYQQMLLGACIYELLQTFTILFVPLLNPDGYMISLYGYDAIQNQALKKRCQSMNLPSEEWKFNARGVDINRNFPCRLWKPKYDRDRAASENETKTLMRLFHEYRSKGFLDFHSRGKQIYYYRSMMPESYNQKQLKIASRFSEITNYALMPPEDEVATGDSGGITVHYYSEHFHKPALTIETVDEDAGFPLALHHRGIAFEEIKPVIFEFGSMII